MLDTGIRHVLVADGDEIVGVVSIRDVLRALLA
jgi:CBS domain-containing protein